MLAWGIARLPLGVAMALARHWGWMLAHVLRLRRTYVLETLARCLPETTPEERRRIYARMWSYQAQNIVELLRFAGGRESEQLERIEVRGKAIADQALERGRGLLILISHLGNYDLMGLAAAKLFAYPLTVITKTLKNEKLNEFWFKIRNRSGVRTVPAHNSYRACLRALRNNELVGFMLDQNRPANQGIFVDFFGRPASTTPGLAFMAAQSGAPVVPVFMLRTPEGRHILQALPAIEPPPDRREETLRASTEAYNRILEEQIRQDPAQWLWLHKRWKSRPPEEKSLQGNA